MFKENQCIFPRNPPFPKIVTFSIWRKSVTILGNVTIWGVTIMSGHRIRKILISFIKEVFFILDSNVKKVINASK